MFQHPAKMISCLRCLSYLQPHLRRCSNFSGFLHANITDDTLGIGEIRLGKAPVNALDLHMLNRIADAVRKLESDGCKAFSLTSAVPNIFSAGLNLTDFTARSESHMRDVLVALADTFLVLKNTPMASVACIAGASPAGGCVLSIACDYRIALDSPRVRIGLNEAMLPFSVPNWIREAHCELLGWRRSCLDLQLGTLHTAGEALRVGLVDAVCGDVEQLESTARRQLLAFLSVPAEGRIAAKLEAGHQLTSQMASGSRAEAERCVKIVASDRSQSQLSAYLARIAERKKQKPK